MWKGQYFIALFLVGFILAKSLPKNKNKVKKFEEKLKKWKGKGKIWKIKDFQKAKGRKLPKIIFKGDDPNNEYEANKRAGFITIGDMRFAEENNMKRAATSKNNWLTYNMVNGFLTIPYKLEDSLDSSAKFIINSALSMMNNFLKCHSPFVPYDATKHANLHYLSYFKGSGCWSFVGRSRIQGYTGYQQISIGDRCDHKGTIMHETLHALGFHHEQSRPDRDNYVTINFENIANGAENNFDKQPYDNIHDVSKNSPYDYQSVMHYGEHYFSKNGQPTITVKNGEQIGQRTTLSGYDIIELNNYFKCDGGDYVTTTTTTTTQAPHTGNAVLLRDCPFSQKYQQNLVYYSDWTISGCYDKYSNCKEMKPYCAGGSDWVMNGCALTCGCPAGKESYITIPTTSSSKSSLIKGKFFSTRINATNELVDKKICPRCTSDPCPTYEFCVKLTYQRTATTGEKSRLSITAYNFDDKKYLTDVFVSYPVGRLSANENPAYRYILSQNMRLECNSFNMFVNGTKGADELRVHDFKLYKGPCSSV